MTGRVTGIGGLFFRARDPKALGIWYRDHLGIPLVPGDLETTAWQTEAGTTVFAPFAEDTVYFAADRQFMLNLRVEGLDNLLARLRDAGIEVAREETMEGLGRFARIHDPEGNPVELWEPEG